MDDMVELWQLEMVEIQTPWLHSPESFSSRTTTFEAPSFVNAHRDAEEKIVKMKKGAISSFAQELDETSIQFTKL